MCILNSGNLLQLFYGKNMDIFAWYLVISMVGSDELLVKKMESKNDCMTAQQEFIKKGVKKFKNLSDISCEEGLVVQEMNTNNQNEETL